MRVPGHTPPPSNRRGFFRALREWVTEEGSALAEPFLDEVIERTEPLLTMIAGPPILRPPGAVAETLFRATCTRCGQCVAACPERAIVPAGDDFPAEIAGTPVIIARRRACAWCEPFHCQEACPSGALRALPAREMRLGTAHVLAALCFAHQGQRCDACVVACPLRGEAIEIRRGVPRVHPEACTGCGQCEYACPAHPAAIRVDNRR